MDLSSVGKMASPWLKVMNDTSQPANSSTTFPGILDSVLTTAGQVSPLLQLFLFIYRLVGAQLGLDPSILLTCLGCLWGLSKLFDQVWAIIDNFITGYLRCTVCVTEDDQIYHTLMQFLSEQQDIATNRHLTAQTVYKSAWDEEEDSADALATTMVEDNQDSPKYLNFASDAARCNPRYVPAMGTTGFWHNRTFFRVYRRKETLQNTGGWGGMAKDVEELKISCFGRSTDPIKSLLKDAKTAYFLDTRYKTAIFRPRIKENRRESWSMWQQVARRPIRPMSTVILENQEKHEVLRDINEYLHPATPKWYAFRGIPLRRGYLFHGPPVPARPVSPLHWLEFSASISTSSVSRILPLVRRTWLCCLQGFPAVASFFWKILIRLACVVPMTKRKAKKKLPKKPATRTPSPRRKN
ncbi:hypothetical protein NXS19_009647 [Fusarium pseudograminearum]|nr:hypothetical protein NXS19_009647 [Fusarium pseudograminearum]